MKLLRFLQEEIKMCWDEVILIIFYIYTIILRKSIIKIIGRYLYLKKFIFDNLINFPNFQLKINVSKI